MAFKLKTPKFLKRSAKKDSSFYKNVLYYEFIAMLFEIINDGELKKASEHIVSLYMDRHNNNYVEAKNDLFEGLKNSTINFMITQRFNDTFDKSTAPTN